MVVVGLVVLVVVVESPVLGCPHDIIDIQATDRQNLSVCRTPPRHDQVSSAVSNDCRNRRRSPGNKKEKRLMGLPFFSILQSSVRTPETRPL